MSNERYHAGVVQTSDAERANMNMVVSTLRNTANLSINTQRREKNFSGADWKWIQIHTYIDNPYANTQAPPMQVAFIYGRAYASYDVCCDLVLCVFGRDGSRVMRRGADESDVICD